VVDLPLPIYSSSSPFPANILPILKIRHQQKRSLETVLCEILPDIVVSSGGVEKNVLPYIKGKWKLVFVIHILIDARIREARTRLEKVFAKIGFWLQYRLRMRHFDGIIVLTEEEKRLLWGNNPRARVIPNPLRFIPTKKASLKDKRLIAAGRLVSTKNYASLIRAFGLIASHFPDWTLDIFGRGPESSLLSSVIENLNLEGRVHLKDFSPRIQDEMISSSIFVHTSLWESFGLVLIEAMSLGLPVVAYDCPFGPRSIITDGKDGFLVPLNDEVAFAECLSQLMKDEELRLQMGANAEESSKQYDLESITERWMALFRELVDET
jgi:glycosyltransferase involved in cell wall biosynthesis